jgi:hypothetical protein
VFGPSIEYKRPLPELLVDRIKKNERMTTKTLIDGRSKKIDKELRNNAVKLHGYKLVSLYGLMCKDWECPTLTPDGTPMQWDDHHLTREGSIVVGEKLMPIIEAELKKEKHAPMTEQRTKAAP